MEQKNRKHNQRTVVICKDVMFNLTQYKKSDYMNNGHDEGKIKQMHVPGTGKASPLLRVDLKHCHILHYFSCPNIARSDHNYFHLRYTILKFLSNDIESIVTVVLKMCYFKQIQSHMSFSSTVM